VDPDYMIMFSVSDRTHAVTIAPSGGIIEL
jgi:hypothetical protein